MEPGLCIGYAVFVTGNRLILIIEVLVKDNTIKKMNRVLLITAGLLMLAVIIKAQIVTYTRVNALKGNSNGAEQNPVSLENWSGSTTQTKEAVEAKIIHEKLTNNSNENVHGYYDFFTRLRLNANDKSIAKMPMKSKLNYLARKYYNEITDVGFVENIDVINKYATVIKGYGKAVVAEVNVWGRKLSNVTPKRCYLLYSKENKDAFVFDFNSFFLIKDKLSDNGSNIGGVILTKGIGYFLCYSFEDSSFVKIFDSGFDIKESEIAVPIYLNNGGCIKYLDNYLNFKNIDINNDGFLDLTFVGTVLYYCKPEEYGVEINSRKPIKEQRININYIRKDIGNRAEWVLSDTVMVTKLLNNK